MPVGPGCPRLASDRLEVWPHNPASVPGCLCARMEVPVGPWEQGRQVCHVVMWVPSSPREEAWAPKCSQCFMEQPWRLAHRGTSREKEKHQGPPAWK